MKQPKKLTYEQKKLLSKTGYNPKEWMFVGEDLNIYIFVQKGSNKVLELKKGE